MFRFHIDQESWPIEASVESSAGTVRGGTIGVRAVATGRRTDGTVLTVRSAGRVGIRADDREAAAAAYEEERKRVADALKELAGRTPVLDMVIADRDAAQLRRTLLDKALPGTGAVLDLIDSIGRIEGVEWAYAPGLGFRGSVTKVPPKLVRNTANEPGRDTAWANDGEYDCMCPLALLWDHENTGDEQSAGEVHADPFVEARRRHELATGEDAAKEPLGEVPWCMLVLASDACAIDAWMEDHADEELARAARGRADAMAGTLDAVRTWMVHVLQPSEPEVLTLTRAGA